MTRHSSFGVLRALSSFFPRLPDTLRLALPAILAGFGLAILLLALAGPGYVAYALSTRPLPAAAPLRDPAPSVITVCLSTCPYTNVQAAVRAVAPDGLVKVAQGVYTDSGSQVVQITQSLTLRGGYTTTDWSVANPVSYPTVLDGESIRRVVYISDVAAMLEGFYIRNGYVADNGAGIYIAGTSNPTITGNYIHDNLVTGGSGRGGGIYVYDGNAVIQNNEISTNTVTKDGGGIYVWSGSPTIESNQIYGNSTSDGDQDNGGGGIYITGGSSTVRRNNIYNNQASCSGGEGCSGGGMHIRVSNGVVVERNIIHDNSTVYRGGGIHSHEGQSNITIRNNLVYGNRTTRSGTTYGGGIGAVSGTTIENNTIYSNTANSTGGGIDSWGTSPTARNNIVYDNSPDNYDASVTCNYCYTSDPKFVNAAAKDLHLRGDSSCIDTADPSSYSTNDYDDHVRPFGARADIGAFEYYTGTCFAQIDPATRVYTNVQEAVDSATSGQLVKVTGICQGAFPRTVGSQTFSQTAFIGQELTLRGGYTLTNWLTPTTVLDARGQGRAVYITGTGAVTVESLELFNGNAARGGGGANAGGAVYVASGNATISRTTMYSNTATSGGGVYNAATALLWANRLYSNTATLGGGVYNAGTVTFRNNLIYTNTANSGGAVYVTGTATLENNTLYANSANTGGAVYKAGGVMGVTNTLFISHTASITGGAVYAAAGGSASLDYNDWWANTPNHGNVVTGAHSLIADPSFADARRGDFHLPLNSPAVDKGFNTGVGVDFDGLTRPQPSNGEYDIGAFETLKPLAFLPDYPNGRGQPGRTVIYTHAVTNTGYVPASFGIVCANPPWSNCSVSPSSAFSLGIGIAQTVYVSFTVPAGVFSATVNVMTVTATSSVGPTAINVHDTTLVGQLAGVIIAPEYYGTLSPGQTITYTHWVTNTGNYTDIFTLELTGPWAGLVTSPTVVTLGYLGTQQVQITVTVPMTAAAFLTNTAVLRAVSQADLAVSAAVTDTTSTKSTTGDRFVWLAPGGDDTNNNCIVPTSPCATVHHAVEQAADGDTVKVAGNTPSNPAVYYETELRINKNITLLGGYPAFDGSGSNWTSPTRNPDITVLDGQGLDRVIYIPGVGLAPVIDGFTIRNGSTKSGQGGGLFIETSASPTLRDVKFESNHADSSGGGIYIAGGSLTLDKVTFQNNTAYRGAGLYNVNATLTINAAQFSGNAATDRGGALYNGSGSLELGGQSVVQNNSAQNGGGVYNAGGSLVITNTTLAQNTASSGGGALYHSAGAATLFNNMVYSNTASSGNGGGVYVSAGTVSAWHNTFYLNVAPSGSGGGFYNSLGMLRITNTLVISNVAGAGAVGIHCAGGACTEDYNDVWGAGTQRAGVAAGAHSISANPLFVDPAMWNLRLDPYSPAIDKGDPNTGLTFDYYYNPRPAGQGYDLGAHEYGDCWARVNHLGADGPILYNIQGAIDSAQPNDIVKVAGVCVGVHPLPVGGATVYQTVHLTKTITLRGGYTFNIWNDPPPGPLAILDARGWGRVIYISGTVAPTIEGLRLLNGKATGLGGGPLGQDAGGALYNWGGQPVITGTTLYGGAADLGGGFYNANNGAPTLVNATLDSNAAGQGGGAYNYYGTLTLTNTVVVSNAATSNGGGLFNSSIATLVVSRTTILSNTATTSGGGIYADYAGSGAPKLQADANSIHDNRAATGAGVYVKGGSATLQNNMIYSNTATSNGGGVYADVGGSVQVQNNTFYSNRATNGGGVYNNNATMALNSNIIVTNTATTGSGIYNVGGTLTADYNDVLGTRVGLVAALHDLAVAPLFVNPAAGDFHLREGSPVMDKGDPSATLTSDYDGDVRPSQHGLDVGADEIGGCFARINNGAVTYGSVSRAVALAQPGDLVKVAGRCIGVYGAADGGTVYTQTVYLTKTLTLRGGYTLTDWLVSDPYANPTLLDPLRMGRGLVISGTITPTIEGLRITGGNATLGGGGVYVLSGAPILSATMLYSNTASEGGALYVGNGTVTLLGSLVMSNTASNGGGLRNANGTLVVSRTTIYTNTAVNGGGIYNSAATLVQASRIYSNTASSLGGGLYNSSGSTTLQNNLIYANVAPLGGGVNVDSGSVVVEHNTIYGNRSSTQGSGLYNDNGATMRITSTIVVSNVTSLTGTFGVYISGTASLDYNDVWGNTPGNVNAGVPTGTHSLAVNPLFVSAAAADFHLQLTSPLIDKGDPATRLTTDYEGTLRPGFNGFDIGAYEVGGCFVQNARTSAVYGSVQRAVDTANSGDLIKLAGYCWGVQSTQGYTQTVYINKSLTLRGGYTPTNWTTSLPITQPATLDALGRGRVAFISATTPVTLETIHLGNGNAALGGGANAGGAVYNSGGQPTLRGDVVYSSTANNGGGFYNASGNPKLQNNVFYSNTATVSGGAIYIGGGTATVLNNTLYNNRAAYGGGVYNGGTNLSLVNTILANNTATTLGGGLRSAGTVLTVDYNDWWSNSAPTSPHSDVATGTHSLSVNPLFEDAPNGDFHLTQSSPLVDVGDRNTQLNVDMDNEYRPMLETFDIGADEAGGCYARLYHLGYDYPIVYNVQDAIDAASLPTDTVKVAGTCWGVRAISGPGGTYTQTAYIAKSLTLQGGYSLTNWVTPAPVLNGATSASLDARGRGRVVYVANGVTVNINGFTLQNGNASRGGVDSTVGGGVYNNVGSLTLHLDNIINSTASRGGGLYNNGGTVILDEDLFIGDSADYGGGLYVNGGTVSINGYPTAFYGDFQQCTANLSGGGAYVDNNGTLNVGGIEGWVNREVWFWFNDAQIDGGGVYVNSGAFNLSTYYWIYGNNAVTGNGGGVYVSNGASIAFNSAAFIDGHYRIVNNTAANNGGGLYSDGGTATIPTVWFQGNEATSGNGGAFYQTGSGAQARLENTLAENNTAPLNSGGAFYNDNGTLTSINNTLVGNSAGQSGGAFHNHGGVLIVTNTIMVSNTAGGSGGGLQCEGGTCQVAYNDFWHNSAPSNPDSNISLGAGTRTENPQFAPGSYTLLYTSPLIDRGTPVPVYRDAKNVTRPQFVTWDMGMYEFTANLRVQVSDEEKWANPGETIVFVNTVQNTGDITDTYTITATGPWLAGVWPITTPALGPDGITTVRVTVTVPISATICDQSVVNVTAASTLNPAVTDTGKDTTNVNLVPVMTLTPDPNTGVGRPGETLTYTHVLSNNANVCSPTPFNISFVNSQYSWSEMASGSPVYLARGQTATLQVAVHLYDWVAPGIVDQATVKATLDISRSNFVIASELTTISPTVGTRYVAVNGTDTDNNCTDPGHGACATAQHAIDQASPGDEIRVSEGVYQGAYAGTISIGKSVTVTGGYTNVDEYTTFDPARHPTVLDAQWSGTVVSIAGSITPTVAGLQLVNGSGANGGGIHVSSTLPVTLSALVVYGNNAGNGGGLYVNSGDVRLYNSILRNNSVTADGGGVYVNAGAATLVNDTLYGNNANTEGGGIYNAAGATLWVTNTVIAKNDTLGSCGIYNDMTGIASLAYNNVWENTPGSCLIGANAVLNDPQFQNPALDDLHLTAGSPVINRGTTVPLAVDLDNVPRPQMAAFDMGAYEFATQPGLQLAPAFASQHAMSNTFYYQHVLTNAGNYTDTVTFSIAITINPPNQTNWTVTMWPTPTVTLAQGMTTTVYVTVSVAPGTLTGTVGTAIITATSSLSQSWAVRAVDTTSFQSDVDVSITKSVTPAGGWLGPGYPVTYTLVYSNGGPTASTGVVITDLVPITLTDVTFTYTGASLTRVAGITYTWNVSGALPVGSGGIITVTGRVITQGLAQVVAPFANTATITTTQNDTAPANNTGSVSNGLDSQPPVMPTPPLISPPDGVMTTSQSITFTWNTFYELSGSGVLSYQFYLSRTFGGVYSVTAVIVSPTTSYVVNNLPRGSIYNWTVRAFDAAGNATDWATPYGLTIDLPGLSVDKDAPGTLVRGAPFSYTLSIHNGGLVPATGVVVTDVVPSGVSYISGGSSFGGGNVTWTGVSVDPISTTQVSFVVSTCQTSADNLFYRVVTSTQGISSTLGASRTKSLSAPTIEVDFDQSAQDIGTNQPVYLSAVVTTTGGPVVYGWSYGDGQTGSGSAVYHSYTSGGVLTITLRVTDSCGFTQAASHPITVHVPSVDLSKTAVGIAPAGAPLTYTLWITNTGLNDLSNVILTDTLPSFITGGYAVPPVSAGTIGAGQVITWAIGDMASGAQFSMTLVAMVASPITNGIALTNNAWITSTEGAGDFSSASTVITSTPVLAIRKSAPTTTAPGAPLTYTLRYTNTGNGNATGVVLADALPMNVSGGYVSPTQSSGAIGAGQAITWSGLNVPGAGGVGSITLVVTVTRPTPNGTVLTNTATITSTEGANSATGPVTATVVSAPALTIRKTSTPTGNVSPGDWITYTLVVTNTGTEDTVNATITDTTPLSTTFIGAGFISPATGSFSNPGVGLTGTVVWQLTAPITTPGGSAAVTLTVRVNSPLNNRTLITNTGYSATAVDAPTPAIGSPVTHTVVALPNLAISKVASSAAPANTPLTYTLRYTNTGNGNAFGVVITDRLPLSITGGYAAPPQSSGAIGAGQVITWSNLSLPGDGGVGSITLVVTVARSLMTGTVLLNTAGITCSDGVSATTGSVAVTTYHGAPVSLAIAPAGATVQAGFTQTYRVTGTDVYNNLWDATLEVTYTVSAGGTLGTPPGNNVLTATTPVGAHVITATATSGVSITTTVYVTVGTPVSLTILPRNAAVTAGDWVNYTAIVTDAYGNWKVDPTGTTFTSNGGGAWSGGYVFSATVAGTWVVTGTHAPGRVDTTTLTINPGPLAQLRLSTLVTQTAGEPFTLTITALDAFGNATPGSGVISLTDSTRTLTPVTWSSWSGSMMTPTLVITRALVGCQITATVAATPTIWRASNLFTVLPNVPANITLAVNPTAIPLNGTAHLTATAVDTYTNLVVNGTVVTLTTTAGALPNGQLQYTTTTSSGVALAWLSANCVSQTVTLAAQAGTVVAQTPVNFVAPGVPYTVTLDLQSNTLPVGGVTTTLTSTVRDCSDNWVADSTPVALTIAPITATMAPSSPTTLNGEATATLTSPIKAGRSVITATSGSAWARTVVTFTPLSPFTMTVWAAPSMVMPLSSTSVIANVTDLYSNGVADGTPVTFTAVLGTIMPVITTTVNGRAPVVFTAGDVEGIAIVTATVRSDLWATTTISVSRNLKFIYLPLVLRNYSPPVPGKNLVVSNITTASNPANVRVEIKNMGDATVTEQFWVILYLDPTSNITINKFWWDVGCPYYGGAAWKVTTPLAPGQSLTLAPADATPPYQGFWPPSFNNGQHTIAAQVDAYSDSGTTGLVQETNEGDNILSKIFTVP